MRKPRGQTGQPDTVAPPMVLDMGVAMSPNALHEPTTYCIGISSLIFEAIKCCWSHGTFVTRPQLDFNVCSTDGSSNAWVRLDRWQAPASQSLPNSAFSWSLWIDCDIYMFGFGLISSKH
jgi:hypothetical protein